MYSIYCITRQFLLIFSGFLATHGFIRIHLVIWQFWRSNFQEKPWQNSCLTGGRTKKSQNSLKFAVVYYFEIWHWNGLWKISQNNQNKPRFLVGKSRWQMAIERDITLFNDGTWEIQRLFVESTWNGPGNTPPGCKPSPLPHQGRSPGVWGPGVLMNSQTGSVGETY